MSTFSQQLKRVYPAPSHIPVRVKMADNTFFRHYPTMSGQPIFDYDSNREFDVTFRRGLQGILPIARNNVLQLNFFYTQNKCAILIYFDATDVTWKVITAHKESSSLTMKYYRLYNTMCLQEVDRAGKDIRGSVVILYDMYFDMELANWTDMPDLAAGDKATNYDTTVSTFRVKL